MQALPKAYIITETQRNELINYLGTQPYVQVNKGIAMLFALPPVPPPQPVQEDGK